MLSCGSHRIAHSMARSLAIACLLCVSTAGSESLPAPRLDAVRKRALHGGTSAAVVADRGLQDLVDPCKVEAPPRQRGKLREAWLKRRAKLVSAPIAVNVVLWWTLNVVFGLANKQCLNNWPHPWALACLHLAVGSACMLLLYLPLPRGNRDWVRAPRECRPACAPPTGPDVPDRLRRAPCLA